MGTPMECVDGALEIVCVVFGGSGVLPTGCEGGQQRGEERVSDD